MNYVFINSEVLSNYSTRLDRFANHCLSSHRYLFNGRTIEVWKKNVINVHPSFPEKNWQATAASMALWIPGLILGLLAKMLAPALSRDLRSDYQVVTNFGNTFKIPTVMEKSHTKLEKMAESIRNEMTSKDVWSSPPFIEKVSQFLAAALEEIDLIYSTLEKNHNNDADIMAKALIQQVESDLDDVVYSFPYFYDSLTEMYHLARSCAYIESNHYRFPSLEKEDQDPFFNPDNEKSRWREIYNNFCNKLDEHNLRNKLRDGRFANWSVSDTGFVKTYGFPDTRPTRPIGYV